MQQQRHTGAQSAGSLTNGAIPVMTRIQEEAKSAMLKLNRNEREQIRFWATIKRTKGKLTHKGLKCIVGPKGKCSAERAKGVKPHFDTKTGAPFIDQHLTVFHPEWYLKQAKHVRNMKTGNNPTTSSLNDQQTQAAKQLPDAFLNTLTFSNEQGIANGARPQGQQVQPVRPVQPVQGGRASSSRANPATVPTNRATVPPAGIPTVLWTGMNGVHGVPSWQKSFGYIA